MGGCRQDDDRGGRVLRAHRYSTRHSDVGASAPSALLRWPGCDRLRRRASVLAGVGEQAVQVTTRMLPQIAR